MAFNVRPAVYTQVLPVANTVKGGDFVRVGSFAGIAENDARLGEDGLYYSTIALEGIAHVPFSTTTAAIGDALYLTTGGAITKTAGTNKPIGIVTTVKTAADGDVWFRLTPNHILPA